MKKFLAPFFALIFALWTCVLPATAMLTVSELNGFNVGGSGPRTTISYETTVTGATNGAVFTFSATDIGTAAANRTVIVACGIDRAGTATFTSISLDGVNMTEAVAIENPGSFTQTAIYYLLDTADATDDIIVTVSASVVNMQCSVYAAYLNAGTVVDSSSASADTTANCNVANLEVDANGVAVSSVASGAVSITHTIAWTGVDTWTEDYDSVVELVSFASYAVQNTVSSTTDDVDFAESATSGRACAGASFK